MTARQNASVVAGLSGGVDSAVAAQRAKAAGASVLGVSLRLLSKGTDEAHDESLLSAASVASALGIEHRILDATASFERRVLDYVAEAYASGITPNPCVRCNPTVKFELLADAVAGEDAERLVTGHYARIESAHGRSWLRRGADPSKDQSYFLYRLGPDILGGLEFPLGESTKTDVRAEAASLGLPVANRSESQDACFALSGQIAEFVLGRRPEAGEPGGIYLDGELVGEHQGVARYTVGQRKGLGIGGPGPYYVARIDARTQRVDVVSREPSESGTVLAESAVWYEDMQEMECLVQFRHRMDPIQASVAVHGERLVVTPHGPVLSPAPGQSVVCYEGDRVIGGGEICR